MMSVVVRCAPYRAAPYYTNVLAAKRFEFERTLGRINAPVDKAMWFMAPQQVAGLHSLPGRVSDWLRGTYWLSSVGVLTAK